MTINNSPISGNSDQVPFERGSVEHHNRQLLSAHLRHSLKDGEMTASDFAEWTIKPWTALKFLEGRVSEEKNAKKSGGKDYKSLYPEDVLISLRDWSKAADKSAKSREKWEIKNPQKVKNARKAINKLHNILAPSVELFEKTQKDLEKSRAFNGVQNFVKGTKEYIVDDFFEHPAMSAAIVVMSYWSYKRLKGTPMGTTLAAVAGITVGGSFLKEKFGFEPTEEAAKAAERMGLQKAADGIRVFRDTLNRGLFGAEGEGTLTGFYYEKLKLHESNQKAAFRFLLEQNPKQFVEWYDKAGAWKLNRGPRTSNVPGDVSGLVRKMTSGKNVPEFLKNMPAADRVEVLLDVADTVLIDIAKNNGKPANAQKGLATLKEKYVNGAYFRVLWDKFDTFSNDLKENHQDTALQEQIDDIRSSMKSIYDTMERKVQNGSEVITFMDVLTIELSDADFKKMKNYGGPGLSMGDIGDALNKAKQGIFAASTSTKASAISLWKDIEKYFTNTIPVYWGKAWKNNILPVLSDAETKGQQYRKDVEKWLNTSNASLGGKTPIEYAEMKGAQAKGAVMFVIEKGSPLADFAAQIGIQAGGAIEMTIEQIKELAEWLDERKRMTNCANSFGDVAFQDLTLTKGTTRATRSVIKYKINTSEASPDLGYEYYLHITPIEEKDTTVEGGTADNHNYLPLDQTNYMKSPPVLNGYIVAPYSKPTAGAGYMIKRAEVQIEIRNSTGSSNIKSKVHNIQFK
jgi:hypothetical protein